MSTTTICKISLSVTRSACPQTTNADPCQYVIGHDFRRTAVRNLERAGVPRSAAMRMTGHKTGAVYRRYAITDSAMLQEAAVKLAAFMWQIRTVQVPFRPDGKGTPHFRTQTSDHHFDLQGSGRRRHLGSSNEFMIGKSRVSKEDRRDGTCRRSTEAIV
jgi:hypothetical protein